ncbi:MAG: glutamine-hydrolyzing carbamoyl-phosphate synthase small subunit [Candidatus Bathyarchaeia archaeon]
MEPQAAEDSVKDAVLVLEDGSCFHGIGFGAVGKVSGEVVFNTGMVGYPESISDPSYFGQILVQTYPLIGNYGITSDALESDGPKIEGYVIHELCVHPSHWSMEISLNEWLRVSGIPGISGVDTRFLTQVLRKKGTMLGILVVCENPDELDLKSLLEEVKTVPDPNKRKLAYEVAVKKPQLFDIGAKSMVVIVDCGVKKSITRNLLNRGVNVLIVPPQKPVDEILALEPSGVVFSNGPGNPAVYDEVVETAQTLAESGIPMFGICLGCQILALALGGRTYKLKFGHRGQNHPCIETNGKRCFITSQNHGYAIDADSLSGTDLEVTLINANDKTVEGIKHRSLPIFAVQFHPEASPGPNDTNSLFDVFVEETRRAKRHA